ncbi:unnamed protein product [Sphagnum troendelagicum]|uniref:UBX domain-containing protein n=1 Tax=Sphagnum troendelagicum TaxID=128251 RepID=A0ABP0USD2_9BRYO
MDQQAVHMFTSITGSSDAVAAQKLEEHGGDLNSALDAYYNMYNTLGALPQHNEEPDRRQWMDEDAPISLQQLVQPQAPFSVLPVHPTRAVPESTLERFGEQSSFLHTSTLPQVSSPQETRNVPIEWHDLQDEGLGPQQLHNTSGVRIEELPASDSTEDFLATTSLFRPLTDSTTPNIGQFPYVNYEDMDETSIREVSGMTNEENRFHDEMLHAAIEASKREVEIANQRGRGEFMQVSAVQGAAEEDDIARAISDSLKTAEEEKALRELGEASGPFFMEEIEDIHRIHGQQANESKRIEDRDASILADRRLQEELEDLNENEQPLLRRPLRRSSIIPGSSGLAALPALSVIESLPARLQQSSEHNEDSVSIQNAAASAAATGLTQQNGESFPDEWGGISSEEHDEAIMLEAALFGGLPRFGSSDVRLPFQPHQSDDGVINADTSNCFDIFDTGRPFQLPPSPSVVEQRRLREEQDNAYSESLALDRQKEIIALQEAEALHRKEEDEAAARHALDYLQQEEQLKLQGAAEELERQLATKRASLPDEPAPEDENAVKLVVRMPDNTRRDRRFHKSDKLQSVFDFIDVLEDVKPGTYRLIMAPRRVFTDKEHESSLQSLGLTSKSLLNFELIA